MSAQEPLIGTSDDDEPDTELKIRAKEEENAQLNPSPSPKANEYRTAKLVKIGLVHVKWLFLGCVALIFRLPFSLAMPYFVTQVIDSLYDSSHNFNDVKWNIIYMAIAGTVDAIMDFWCVFLFGYAQQRIVKSLRLDLFQAILKQDIGFFDQTPTGEITSRLTADCQEMANDLTWVFRFSIEAIVRIGCITAYMLYASWKLGLVACGIIPLVAIINRLYSNWLHKNAEAVQTALAKANTVAQEAISNMRTVFSFANEATEQTRYWHRVERHYRLNVRQTVITGIYYMGVSTFLMNTVVQIALLVFGSYLVLHESLPPSTLLAFMLYQAQLQEYFTNLLNSFTSLIKSSGAGAKVFELLERVPDCRGSGNREPVVLPGTGGAPGAISIQNVTFSYPSRPDLLVLKDVNFEVRPGQVVALVGSSGSGKSTIFHLLENFYEPNLGNGSGGVRIDGFDVGELKHDWLHRKVAIVGQEPVLFSGTIEFNILYSCLGKHEMNLLMKCEQCMPNSSGDGSQSSTGIREALNRLATTDDRLEDEEHAIIQRILTLLSRVPEAAKVANAHSFVSALPEGYQTEVGERGLQLSGGQKQRIAIARAILQDPAILLLDEATSALDTESEAVVQVALEKAMKGRTVLIIAHRLSTIAHADNIVVLHAGHVIEMGTHSDLIQRNNRNDGAPSYRTLIAKQTALLAGDPSI